ncbi:glycine betaine/proline transport system substrate-binding protein [Agromyces terreus]|uniref:Glycine betaine/proline transport system substrate-binding protein n=1 Tax=Agromyces terreus TaxID=424795 RepID=A0A9X2KBA9_9MICO|nr:glycine betaine ABC transporter substrate-binding protein [Agromyces terreus]MCP2370404.1 glycine betaine/proline transport system substrate-binding protein [Agromyces terreus]
MKKSILTGAFALSAASALILTGCASDGGASAEGDNLDNGDRKDVTIAVFNGWDEGVAASELWNAILTEKGYDVELEYADVAPVYQGLTDDDYDVVLDTWLPITHADYMDEYGDELNDLGAWNDDAALTIAVNADAPIDSLDELAANADLFDNRLVGIEPGSGLNGVTTDTVIPTYGLEDMEYLTSSTPAMLAELKAATDAGENIAVTLWSPHWAYDAFPIKNLEDPEGTLGDAESIHTVGGKSFPENFPTLSGWLSDFKMDTEKLSSLENAMFNENDTDDYGPIVEQWIADNQEYVDSLTS